MSLKFEPFDNHHFCYRRFTDEQLVRLYAKQRSNCSIQQLLKIMIDEWYILEDKASIIVNPHRDMKGLNRSRKYFWFIYRGWVIPLAVCHREKLRTMEKYSWRLLPFVFEPNIDLGPLMVNINHLSGEVFANSQYREALDRLIVMSFLPKLKMGSYIEKIEKLDAITGRVYTGIHNIR